MLTLKITIKEKDADNSNVTIKAPTDADLKKATDNEKATASVVYNSICEALKNLN